MADATGISWCDATFNPWIGCAKVSPACAHCYAETFAENRMGLSVWGEDADRRVTAVSTWKRPIRYQRLAVEGRLPNGTANKDGHRPRIFCASMADVFEERGDLEEPRRRLFDLIEETPALDWLILTKRPDFARAWLFDFYMRRGVRDWTSRDALGWGMIPNVWLGVSIENARFTWRADVLRDTPATVRFISAEPLLGSLFREQALVRCGCDEERHGGEAHDVCPYCREYPDQCHCRDARRPLDLTGIDWLIVGGESGARRDARPAHPSWVRQLRDEVQRIAHYTGARPALHFKQWGSWTPDPSGEDVHGRFVLPTGRVVAPLEADAYGIDLTGAMRMRYAGAAPGSGGKFLDGTDWCEFPTVADLLPAVGTA